MALSVLVGQLAAASGRLASEPLVGRLPGLVMFGGGMLVGGLVVVLAGWLSEHSWAARLKGWPAGPAPAREGAWSVPPLPATTPAARLVAAGAGAATDRARPARPRPRAPAASAPTHAPRLPQPSSLQIGVLASDGAPRPPQPSGLQIGVLGSLTINGQAGALLPAQSQLIVSLALNPRGVSNRQLRTLLGADQAHPKPADSLRQLIARTRRALGRSEDGKEWIEHLGRGRYALHPAARLDWREFERLAAEGTSQARTGPLTDALGLVRGQPFAGCYYWWLETATIESVTATIVAAAEALATLSLAGGDPGDAVRASRIGLTADPSAEPLWRILMRAEHAAGNLAGVREAWNRCTAVIAEVAADGQPDPATEAVFNELTAASSAGGTPAAANPNGTGHRVSQTSRAGSSHIFPG